MFECRHPSTPAEVTLADCAACVYAPRKVMPDPRKLLLKNGHSPGDVLIMTAAVRSLHAANPGRFLTAVDTTADQLWEHNPDAVPRGDGFEEVQTHYPLINECNQRGVHVLQGYCDFLADALGVRVPLLVNRPVLHLSADERVWLPQVHDELKRPARYWVVCAGRKDCYTAKFWGTENYQRVVDLLRGRVLFVQVGAAGHHHPPLRNAVNLVGRTDLRQLVRLCFHAEGGLGGVTLLQHLMAALEKPYVCLLGGREPVQWNAYPRQQTFHTGGALPACAKALSLQPGHGCWRSRTVQLGDGKEQDGSLCADPVPAGEPVPRCLAVTRPEEVAEKILLTDSLLRP